MLAPDSHAWMELFRHDAARWIEPEEIGDPESLTWPAIAKLLVRWPGLRAMAWMRFGGWLQTKGVRGGPSFVQRHLHRVYGFEISAGSPVGGGCYVAHTVGTTIRARQIGENATIVGALTIGGAKDNNSDPVLGNRVFLGTGCRVLGAITLGDDVKVGANAVVLSDVADGVTVVGIPARPTR